MISFAISLVYGKGDEMTSVAKLVGAMNILVDLE